jgi:hypothetical protein
LAVDYEGTGRKLGIGMKVAGRMMRRRMEGAKAGEPAGSDQGKQAPSARGAEAVKAAARGAKAARAGGKRFGEAVWGPFTRAGHVLWLEVTGVFFGLFALFFLSEAWRLRAGLHGGVQQSHFWMFVAMGVVFVYFCVSSFLRARKRGKR